MRFWKIVCAGVLVLTGCREIQTITPEPGTPDRSVILVNSSFELGSAATYSGWSVNDVQRAGFSSDTPPDGGNWAAALITAPLTPVYIQTVAPTTPGTRVYKVTLWGKKTVIDGSVSVLLKRDSGSETSSTFSISQIGWYRYTLLDTLSALPGDSIVVRLSGGRSDVPTGSVLYDLFLLEQL